jgi:hypothetical protein
MINELTNIFSKIRYGNKWAEKRLEVCPYFVKWREIQKNIKNAQAYDDWRNIQQLSIQLQWLVSIADYEFDQKVKEIRREKLSLAHIPLIKALQQLDAKEIRNQIYLKFEKDNFAVPNIFEVHNEHHQKFAFDVVADYETVIRKTKFEGLPVAERSLSFPKEFIHRTLSFFHLFCTWESHGVAPDYAIELRDRLVEFI